MGMVMKAEDLRDEVTVAIKVVAPLSDDTATDQLIKRFRHEFVSCARLKHPNIISVHSFGTLKDGCRYIVMDYLPYPNLSKLLKEQRKFHEREVLKIALQIADAFNYYHKLGIVHRDLKPANLLYSPEGNVTILDFGLARDIDQTAITKSGQVLGTPAYMAPEQLLGRKAGPRTDIYQFGVVVFELLAGQTPFTGEDLMEIVEQILRKPLPTLRKFRPELGDAWNEVLRRCMARRPVERYPSAAELLCDLRVLDEQDANVTLQALPRISRRTRAKRSSRGACAAGASGTAAGRRQDERLCFR